LDGHHLADAVRQAQEQRGINAANLARLAGVSAKTISNLRTGERTNYSDDTLAKVSVALGWPSDTLRRISEGEDPPPSDQQRLDRLEQEFTEIRRQLAEVARRFGEIVGRLDELDGN
jgi:transcriptional regulator with XRE-family HTH domain